jgi:hypothetical protein
MAQDSHRAGAAPIALTGVLGVGFRTHWGFGQPHGAGGHPPGAANGGPDV